MNLKTPVKRVPRPREKHKTVPVEALGEKSATRDASTGKEPEPVTNSENEPAGTARTAKETANRQETDHTPAPEKGRVKSYPSGSSEGTGTPDTYFVPEADGTLSVYGTGIARPLPNPAANKSGAENKGAVNKAVTENKGTVNKAGVENKTAANKSGAENKTAANKAGIENKTAELPRRIFHDPALQKLLAAEGTETEGGNPLVYNDGNDIRVLPQDAGHMPERIIAEYGFLLGRRVTRSIVNTRGDIIIKHGVYVTGAVVETARKYGRLIELTKFSN